MLLLEWLLVSLLNGPLNWNNTMPEILLDIDCEEETCGECSCLDRGNDHCGAFDDYVENNERLPECLHAQDMAETLSAEDDGE